jgi:hypothetical protein
MFIGLRNAAKIFQRFMDEIPKDLDFRFAYLDDIFVFSHSLQEHDQHLHTLCTNLRPYGILLNTSKRVFRVPEISFTGLPNGLFPSRFPNKNLYTTLL